MIRNVAILTFNDLAIAIRNKSIFLILFIPVFVFIAMSFIDGSEKNSGIINVGLVSKQAYKGDAVQAITAANAVFHVTWLDNREYGVTLLKNHQLDAVLLNSEQVPGSLVLLVLKKESVHTLALVESLSALQKAAEGNKQGWVAAIEPLHTSGIQRQALPTWILMLVLLVGFIILPAQVAEEKEKKLLLALLQTPISELEWLAAKLITGMVLILLAVLLLHLLGQYAVGNPLDYLAFIAAGGFCFCAFGIALGFLCRTQASARTLGMIFYLPMLLPSALSDVSQKLTSIAPVLPSYQLYMPVQTILLEDGSMAGAFTAWLYLLLLGVLMCVLAYWLMRKRWLM